MKSTGSGTFRATPRADDRDGWAIRGLPEGSDEELAAAVFASRIIEPMAAQRIAPDAVRRLEEVYGDLSDKLF